MKISSEGLLCSLCYLYFIWLFKNVQNLVMICLESFVVHTGMSNLDIFSCRNKFPPDGHSVHLVLDFQQCSKNHISIQDKTIPICISVHCV